MAVSATTSKPADVALALAALLVLDDERARAVHDHQVALLVGQVAAVAEGAHAAPALTDARASG
jgi:hypothetical protein